MDIREFKEPRTHVIIKDFLTEDEQEKIWEEIKENESKFSTGLYTKDGKEEVHENIKKNLVFDGSWWSVSIDMADVNGLVYWMLRRFF